MSGPNNTDSRKNIIFPQEKIYRSHGEKHETRRKQAHLNDDG